MRFVLTLAVDDPETESKTPPSAFTTNPVMPPEMSVLPEAVLISLRPFKASPLRPILYCEFSFVTVKPRRSGVS